MPLNGNTSPSPLRTEVPGNVQDGCGDTFSGWQGGAGREGGQPRQACQGNRVLDPCWAPHGKQKELRLRSDILWACLSAEGNVNAKAAFPPTQSRRQKPSQGPHRAGGS